jgi:hypothetical protein
MKWGERLKRIKKKYENCDDFLMDLGEQQYECWTALNRRSKMTQLSKLKLSMEKRATNRATLEERARKKLGKRLLEQLAMVKAELAGEEYQATKRIYITGENGKRTATEVPKKVRNWFWQNTEGKWFFEVRYGAKLLMLNGTKKTAIDAGTKEMLPEVIETVITAVETGEMDKAIAATARTRKSPI